MSDHDATTTTAAPTTATTQPVASALTMSSPPTGSEQQEGSAANEDGSSPSAVGGGGDPPAVVAQLGRTHEDPDGADTTPIVDQNSLQHRDGRFPCGGCHLTRYAFGVILILIVAVIWVGASEWIQVIFGSMHFSKPFFLTYFNTMTFASWNVGYLFIPSWRKVPWRHPRQSKVVLRSAEGGGGLAGAASGEGGGSAAAAASVMISHVYVSVVSAASGADDDEPTAAADSAPALGIYGGVDGPGNTPTIIAAAAGEGGTVEEEPPYDLRRLAHAALLFCPLWFLANVLFNYSLAQTSVSSNTILSTTSSIWTLVLSFALLGHRLCAPLKLLAVLLSIAGAVAVALGDEESSHDSKSTAEGDALALISAFFYAAYTTVLKWCLPDERRYSMAMTFGLVGIINTVLMWPGFILLHFAGVEPFEIPPAKVWGPLFVNGMIGTNLSDVLWAKSVILTSPLVATLGLSLTTPTAMLADVILRRSKGYGALYIAGAVVTTLGFVYSNF